MRKITLNILNHNISLNCQDKDEKKIAAVAKRFDERMQVLQRQLSATDLETLMVGGIVIMDELEQATAKYDSLKAHTETQIHTDENLPINTVEHLEKAVQGLENLLEQ